MFDTYYLHTLNIHTNIRLIMLQLTLYDLNNRDAQSGTASLLAEFSGYEGFLSSARFISDESIVTGIVPCCISTL